jgi:ketosteroid isomerase-like protein
MTTTTTTRTNIINYMNAIQAGDEAALRDAFHPDATWWLPGDLPISRTWHGRDAILGEFLPTVMERFVPGSLRFTTHAIAADGDAAFVEWTVEATTVEDKAYKNDYMAIFEHRDGRIATVREYMDTGVMARLLF